MELLVILSTIAAIVLFIIFYRACINALNVRAEEKYGFRPLSISMCLLATVPYLIILAAMLLGGDNLPIGVFAGFAVLMMIFIRIARKSSLATALLALPLLAIAGLGVILIMLLLYLVFGQKKEGQPQARA